MAKTPGKRIYADEDVALRVPEGGYGKDPRDGRWYARPPGMHLGSLENHEVIEHSNGTISVRPSIMISDGETQWHGYLRHGVWEN